MLKFENKYIKHCLLQITLYICTQITTTKSNIMSTLAFAQIKNIASSRSTQTLKQDIIVAYKNKESKNSDATKTIYHALCEVLIEKEGIEYFENFEETYIK